MVAEVCQNIGLARWGDEHDPTTRHQVSGGTATTARRLHGLGFSTRHQSVVPQDGATKPVAHLRGKGITADMDINDGLGRTLEWLSAHGPITRCAGVARRARQVFGVSPAHVPVHHTSFSVSGASERMQESAGAVEGAETEAEAHPAVCAITSGSSRDHREDLTP
jgi:hypothetical protein